MLVFSNSDEASLCASVCERVCLRETLPKKVEAFRTILESRSKELVRVRKRSGLVILFPGSEAEERRLEFKLDNRISTSSHLSSQSHGLL